jgi:hypothetical protein
LGLGMMDSAEILSNPVVAFVLRAALGAYVAYMAREFYADPFGYFRRWMPSITETAIARKFIRGLACFCVWGGCFIVATAIATQIFGLHGMALGYGLVTLAAIATWFLLPKIPASFAGDEPGDDNLRRMK